MARALNRKPLNIAVCFVLWSFRGGVNAPPVDLGWGGLPTVWPGQVFKCVVPRTFVAARAARAARA